jgi:hypothetical protein
MSIGRLDGSGVVVVVVVEGGTNHQSSTNWSELATINSFAGVLFSTACRITG